ncbi:MAG: T9SS type A sorting domain-containing protein [Candidatus Pacearchaeota archaeon]|jgi:hypothetical protein
MKKANKLKNIGIGLVATGISVLPSFTYSQNENIPYKEKSLVSEEFKVPVINSVNVPEINFDNLKEVNLNLEKKIIDYITLSEAIDKNLAYSPSEGVYYSERASEIINKEYENSNSTDNVNSFYGDQYLNPFIQPNLLNAGNFDLSYYGSGDANDDNVLNWQDYNLIISGTSNDRTDINGDQVTNTLDSQLIYNYLTDEIPYLPSHWNFLTSSEKEFWDQKTQAIDLTNLHAPGPNWDCNQYSMQTQINKSGIENIENSGIDFSIYDTTQNARFNEPFYIVSTMYTSPNILHSINAFLKGNSSTNFNDWVFVEPQNDQIVTLGSPSMHPDSYAHIKKYAYYYNSNLGQYVYTLNTIAKFDLQNGNATLIWQHPDLIVNKPEECNHVHVGGQMPSNIDIEYSQNSNLTAPENTGEVTGNAPWSYTIYSDSSNQSGTVWDSTYYNFDIYRDWFGKSLENVLIDTTYGTIDNVHFPNKPAQLISVRDTENPEITNIYVSGPVPFTQAIPVPLADADDNSGHEIVTRISETSTQGLSPDSCNYYNFTQQFTDHAQDPTGNFTDTTYSRDVYLDIHQWASFPANAQINYSPNITTSQTGGLPTAFNPTGIEVIVEEDPSKINSTQNPDSTDCQHYNYEFDWAHNANDTICYNSIQQNQHVSVVETEPPYWAFVPADTTIKTGESMAPEDLGWAVADDTISNVVPEVNYTDELIEEIPNVYRLWERHWSSYDICGTPAPDTSQYITEDISIGVPEKPKTLEDKFKVYPNPSASGKIKFNYEVSKPEKIYAEVYEMSGRLVDYFKEEIYPGNKDVEFDLSNLANGMYILEVSSSEKKLFEQKISKVNSINN